MLRFTTVVAVALLAAACTGDDGGLGDDGGVDAGIDADLTGPLFEPDHIVEVDLAVAEADWDTLRFQTRSVSSLLGTCLMSPFPDPFTYVRATVTIDGQILAEVGLRKKGFLGSLDTEKPSLKLKFDEFRAGQRFAGLKQFTLNNSRQDDSYVRQCLAYGVFTAAGIPATRCNFAHVTVNGRDLGLYVHVEGGSKDLLARHFADPEGNLYEGTLSDFREGWTATFDAKTNESAGDRSDLDAVVAALAVPDAQLEAALGDVVDLPAFFRFWATEMVVAHWDGYASNANNFYAYDDPARGKFVFLPWGADSTFGSPTNPFSDTATTSVQAATLMTRRLYLLPSTRAQYLAALADVLATAWDEDALHAELDRMEALITPIADPDGTGALAAQIQYVRNFVDERRAAIEGELAGGPPVWDQPLRDAPCFVNIGSASGTLHTTWGTAGAQDPFATGTGTLSATLNDAILRVTRVGATAGLDSNAMPPQVQLAEAALLADGTAELVIFAIAPANYHPGTLTLGIDATLGAIYHYTPTTGAFELVGLFSDGTLTLSAAGTSAGAAVDASFTGNVVRNPF